MAHTNVAGAVFRAIAVAANLYLFRLGFTAPNPPPLPLEQRKYATVEPLAEKKEKASGSAKSRDTFPLPVTMMILIVLVSEFFGSYILSGS